VVPYVDVELISGKCSHGDTGFVMRVDGEGFKRTFTIEYNKSSTDGGKVESAIPYSRLTEMTRTRMEGKGLRCL
jgi:hypothetical protein